MSTPWTMAQVVVATRGLQAVERAAPACRPVGAPGGPRKDLRLVPMTTGKPGRDQDVEVAEQQQVVAAGLAEADAGVDPHLGERLPTWRRLAASATR